MLIFCANHGVAEEGVSAYPAEVTRQMMANFHCGGAAINVLCRQFGIQPVIVDMDVDRPTRNFTRELAMTRDEAQSAIETGRSYARPPRIFSARAKWASPTPLPRQRCSAPSPVSSRKGQPAGAPASTTPACSEESTRSAEDWRCTVPMLRMPSALSRH